MADDSVSVQFGADTGSLVGGVDEVKDKLGELSSSGGSLADMFGKVGEALAAAFAVDKIAEMTAHMSELGEQIERTAQMTGLSTDAVQQFQYAMKMTGGDAESAGITIERLERNMLTASTGTGSAAKAFQALGINIKDAEGNIRPVGDVLGDLADKFAGAEDGATKTYYAMTLMGRGGAQLIPVLNKGRDGLAELNTQFENTNAKLAPDQVKALGELHQAIATLETAWTGLKELFVADLAPMFTNLIGFVTQLISLFKTADDAVKSFTSGLVNMANSARNAIAASGLGKYVGLGGGVVNTSKLGHVETPEEAASIPDQNKLQEQLNQQLQQLNLVKKNALPTPSGGADKGMETQLQQWKDQLTQQLINEKNFFADSKKEELEFWQDKLQYTKEGSTEQLAVEEQVYSLQKQLAQEDLQDQLATIKQKQEAAKDDFKTVMALEQQKLDLLKKDYGEDSKNYQAALREKETMDREHAAQSTKVYEQFFNSIDKTFDQMLTGILQGTQTWQQAMQRMFSNLAVSFTEAVATMMLKWAAFEALGGSGGGGLATVLGKSVPTAMGGSDSTSALATAINALLGATTAQTAATSLQTTATTTAALSTSTDAASNVLNLGLNTVDTGANTGAIIANTAAPAASAGATGGGLFADAGLAAGIMSFDVGSWGVPQDMLAMVHQGEIILPPGLSAAVRSGSATIGAGGLSSGAGAASGGSGGDNYSVTINAVDSQSFANLMQSPQGQKAIVQIISQQARSNNRTLMNAVGAKAS